MEGTLRIEEQKESDELELNLIQSRGITLDKWPHNDYAGLMRAVELLWHYRDRCFQRRGNRFILRIGGSEVNERIIRCLKRNESFWANCWESHSRGNVYVFVLPDVCNWKQETPKPKILTVSSSKRPVDKNSKSKTSILEEYVRGFPDGVCVRQIVSETGMARSIVETYLCADKSRYIRISPGTYKLRKTDQ